MTIYKSTLKFKAMEEKTKDGAANGGKKFTYEQLSKAFNDLHAQYQKLLNDYRGAVQALNNFDSTSYVLSMLFKVLERPEMYSPEFTAWCAKEVEKAVHGIYDGANDKPEAEQETVGDEA